MDDVQYYSLPGLISDDTLLAFSPATLTLSQLTIRDGVPTLLAQEQFTASEWAVMRVIFSMHPHYCPVEHLHAAQNSKTIEVSRAILKAADAQGTWDKEMRPVRNVISRGRPKLHTFGFTVKSIEQTGYVLMLLTSQFL